MSPTQCRDGAPLCRQIPDLPEHALRARQQVIDGLSPPGSDHPATHRARL